MTDVDRHGRREARVIEHMQSENVQEWDRTMATFSHPRYELPYGTITVTAVKGGLEIPAEAGGDSILIANAAVIVSLDDGK